MQEPDAGLDPGTPGSQPGPKADAEPLSHPGAPASLFPYCLSSSFPGLLTISHTHTQFLNLSLTDILGRVDLCCGRLSSCIA